MATTIRQFPSLAAAQNFYSGSDTSDQAYNQYLQGVYSTPGVTTPVTPGMPGGTLPGTRTNLGSPATGYVPTVPDPTQSAKSALQGNLGNMQYIQQLYQQLQNMMTGQAISNREQLLPGSTALRSTMMGNLANQAAGKLSQGALDQMQTMAAQRGVAMGAPGSPASNSALLRALGLTTEQLQSNAIGDYNKLIAGTPQVPQTDISSQLLNAGDYQQWQYLANVLAASPDPQAAQLANFASAIAGMMQGGTGGNPFRGYFNPGGWLAGLMPGGGGGGTSTGAAGGGYVPPMPATGGGGVGTGEASMGGGDPTTGSIWTPENNPEVTGNWPTATTDPFQGPLAQPPPLNTNVYDLFGYPAEGQTPSDFYPYGGL